MTIHEKYQIKTVLIAGACLIEDKIRYHYKISSAYEQEYKNTVPFFTWILFEGVVTRSTGFTSCIQQSDLDHFIYASGGEVLPIIFLPPLGFCKSIQEKYKCQLPDRD